MTDLIAKARQGRMNALAGLSQNAGHGAFPGGNSARFRTADRHEKFTFISARARQQGSQALV